MNNFDTYLKEITEIFTDSLNKSEWETFINSCSSISAFVDVFPEKAQAFSALIVPLITVMKEKTDLARKNAAVCLAKICKDEENAKVMRANHGTEVLLSLSSVLGGSVK